MSDTDPAPSSPTPDSLSPSASSVPEAAPEPIAAAPAPAVPTRWDRVKRALVFAATHYTGAFVIVLTISIGTSLFSINYLTALEHELDIIFRNDIEGQDAAQLAYTRLLQTREALQDLRIAGLTNRATYLGAREAYLAGRLEAARAAALPSPTPVPTPAGSPLPGSAAEAVGDASPAAAAEGAAEPESADGAAAHEAEPEPEFIAPSPELAIRPRLAALETALAALAETLDQAGPRFHTAGGKANLARARDSAEALATAARAAGPLLGRDGALAKSRQTELDRRFALLEADLRQLINNKTANSQLGYAGVVGQLRFSLWMTLAIVMVSIIIRVFMYMQTRRQQKALAAEAGAACADGAGGDQASPR